MGALRLMAGRSGNLVLAGAIRVGAYTLDGQSWLRDRAAGAASGGATGSLAAKRGRRKLS